jgi:hypothetical protein
MLPVRAGQGNGTQAQRLSPTRESGDRGSRRADIVSRFALSAAPFLRVVIEPDRDEIFKFWGKPASNLRRPSPDVVKRVN